MAANYKKIIKYFEKCDNIWYGLFDHKISGDLMPEKRVGITDGKIILYINPTVYEYSFQESFFRPLDEKNPCFKRRREGKEWTTVPSEMDFEKFLTMSKYDEEATWLTSMMFSTPEGNVLRVLKSKSGDLIPINDLYQQLAENMDCYERCSLLGSKKNQPVKYDWYGSGMMILPVHFDVKTTCKNIVETR